MGNSINNNQFFIPKPDPHFGVKQNENGWFPYIYWINSETSQTHFDNDYMMAHLLGVSPKQYSFFLKENGAEGPKNKVTYFVSKEEAEKMLTVIEEIMNHVYYIDTKNQSDIIYGNTSSDALSARYATHVNSIRAYKNWQQLQWTPPDINVTDKDAKEINSGNLRQGPFMKGNRYTIL